MSEEKEPKRWTFMIGYRKFFIAVWWMCLSTLASVMVLFGWSPARADVTTFGLWVVGIGGFFSAIFVGGNAVEHYRQFWNVSTTASLSQQDKKVSEHRSETRQEVYREILEEREPSQEITGLDSDKDHL